MRTNRPLVSLLLLAVLAVPGSPPLAHAQSKAAAIPPKVPGVVVVQVGGSPVSVEIENAAGKSTAWRAGFAPETCFVDEGVPLRAGTIRLIIWAKAPGTHRIVVWTIGEGREGSAELVIDAGGTPAPPVPPGPEPIPPKPEPPVPPIPVTGFRVLIIYESSQAHTKEQLNILNSTQIVEYLNRKTVKDGTLPGFRKWDKDISVFRESSANMKLLFEAVKPKLTSFPALVIAVDKNATVYPLPATEQETLELLKRYGGP